MCSQVSLRAPCLTCLLFHHAIFHLLLVEGQRRNDGSLTHTRANLDVDFALLFFGTFYMFFLCIFFIYLL